MVTKRLVGIGLGVLGVVIIGGTLAVDFVGAGKWIGLGPAQQQAVAAGFGIFLIGLSLVPLGDRPA